MKEEKAVAIAIGFNFKTEGVKFVKFTTDESDNPIQACWDFIKSELKHDFPEYQFTVLGNEASKEVHSDALIASFGLGDA